MPLFTCRYCSNKFKPPVADTEFTCPACETRYLVVVDSEGKRRVRFAYAEQSNQPNPTTAPVSQAESTKRCPHCQGEIPAKATKCFHCDQSAIEPPARPAIPPITPTPAETLPSPEPSTKHCVHCGATIPYRATKCLYCDKGMEKPADAQLASASVSANEDELEIHKIKQSLAIFVAPVMGLLVIGFGIFSLIGRVSSYRHNYLRLTNRRLICYVGKHKTEMPLVDVDRVDFKQSFLGKRLRYGKIVIWSKLGEVLEFDGVGYPDRVCGEITAQCHLH